MKRNKKAAVYLSLILILTAVFPSYVFGGSPEEPLRSGNEEVRITSAADPVYDAEIRLGECRFLTVRGDANGSAYTWKVSDDRILSVNPEGRIKGLSSNAKAGFSETVVTAEKGGIKHEMRIKVLPAMCIDSSTIGVPGARWDISGIFKKTEGKVRYRSTRKSVLRVDKKGIAKGRKAGKAEVIKEVKTGGSWVEADRESFTVCQPHIRSRLTLSRLKRPSVSTDTLIIGTEVVPSGFKSSRSKVISVEGKMLNLNKQGKATVYTLFGTVGKPLKRYRTRIEVIGSYR